MVERISVIPLINTSYTGFTKSEKKVADIVLKDPQSIIYSSITDLSEQCSVGEATILRFCRKLGFNGYQSFKMTLAQSRQKEDEMEVQLSDNITKGDSIQDMSRKILNTDIFGLNETFALIDYNAIEEVVDGLIKAKRIVFFGVGSSAITAQEAKNKFMRITSNVEFSYDAHMQSMIASLMSDKEVAIAFSHSGSTKDTIEMLKTAKKAGAKTVCVTRHGKSPITQYADHVLLIGAKEGPLQGGSLSTKIAQLFLIDILYTEYFRRNARISKINKEKTAEAISDKLY